MTEPIKISLKAARVNAKLTLIEAANKLGVNKATLLNYEKGVVAPRINTIEQMSAIYQIPKENIFFTQR